MEEIEAVNEDRKRSVFCMKNPVWLSLVSRRLVVVILRSACSLKSSVERVHKAGGGGGVLFNIKR